MSLFGKDEIVVIRRCPYTRESLGVVHMEPKLIAELAGMVQLKDEWAFTMRGRRKGLETWVHKFEVPKQVRGPASVHLDKDTNCGAQAFDGSDDLDIVGVIHSHHTMGAFFSGTDESELNPNFPLSIVIAQGTQILGFSYKAEGRYPLPCGSLGIIAYKIQPTVGDWPWPVTPIFENDGKTDWGDCKKVTKTEVETYWLEEKSECGISLKFPKANVFGTSQEMLPELHKNSTVEIPVNRNLPAVYQPKGGFDEKKFQGYGSQYGYGLEGYYEGWAAYNWPEDNKSQYKGSKLTDVSERWDYMNHYKCPKCKLEWSDVGHVNETSFCEKCIDFAEIKPHASSKREERAETIPYYCAACRDEGEYKGNKEGFKKELCPRCGNATLIADSLTPVSQQSALTEYRICTNCGDDGQYYSCTKEFEMCPECKQYTLIAPSKQEQINLLKKSKNNVVKFFHIGEN